MISAAFQSPPRARQKTRAGSVGDSDGFCRSAAQGSAASSSRMPMSNQRRKSSGVSGPAASISARASASAPIAEQPVDPRQQHRRRRAAALRRIGLGEEQPAEQRPRRRHPLVGMRVDHRRDLGRRPRAPQSAGAKPVSSGGSSPTPSRLTAPSGVTVIVSSAAPRRASERLGGGGVSSISMLSDSHGMALRGSAARGRDSASASAAAPGRVPGTSAPAGHFASTGSSTSRVGAGRSEKIASPTRPTTATSAR